MSSSPHWSASATRCAEPASVSSFGYRRLYHGVEGPRTQSHGASSCPHVPSAHGVTRDGTADVVGTFTLSSAPGFGRQPPEKVPSWRQEPVKVASSGAYATLIVTLSSRTSHR